MAQASQPYGHKNRMCQFYLIPALGTEPAELAEACASLISLAAPSAYFSLFCASGSTAPLGPLNHLLVHSEYSCTGRSGSSVGSREWSRTRRPFAGNTKESSVISMKIMRNCEEALSHGVQDVNGCTLFRRMNPLAVCGHCWSTDAKAVLEHRGTLSVNFLCLVYFGTGICFRIIMAQLAQESHPCKTFTLGMNFLDDTSFEIFPKKGQNMCTFKLL